MPVCRSPWRDDGYDVADFLAVDPRLGTPGDFVTMVRAAHAAGLRVLLDLPLNHVSVEHPWFQVGQGKPRVAVPRLLRDLRAFLSRRNGNAVLLGEADLRARAGRG